MLAEYGLGIAAFMHSDEQLTLAGSHVSLSWAAEPPLPYPKAQMTISYFSSRVHGGVLILARNGQTEEWLGDAPKVNHRTDTL